MKTIIDALDHYGVPARKVLDGTWTSPSPLKTLIDVKKKKEVKQPISLNNYRSRKQKNKNKLAKKSRKKNRRG